MMYLVQVRKEHGKYISRCYTDVWTQALMYYRGINIGAPYTKRLVEISEDDKRKVISRSKGL
jgi:hypothetical protein